MAQEDEHLRLLAIFHWVVAAIAAAFSLLPVIHLVFGILMVTGRLPDADKEPSMAFAGWFFVVIAAMVIACGLTFAVCLALAGRSLSRRRHYTFCLVMAGLACMFVPFGTVLGVFTIILLTKESVKARFVSSLPTAS